MTRLLILFGFFCAFFTIMPNSQAADPGRLEIILNTPDTLFNTGTATGDLNIYLDNYYYEVFGFQFVLISSRPDLIKFNFSETGFDTSGTLTSGFEYVEVIDRAGNQSEYWFRCIADLSFIPGQVDGISPQQGGVAVKIPIAATTAPDTNYSLTSLLSFDTPTDFSDPFGYSIGVEVDTNYDTTYYRCLQWEDSDCTSWMVIEDYWNGFDSVQFDTLPYGYLDTTQVILSDGSISLELLNCDLSGSGELEISDLLCLVDYMFNVTEPYTCPLLYCDTNNDQVLDITDLLFLVSVMFET